MLTCESQYKLVAPTDIWTISLQDDPFFIKIAINRRFMTRKRAAHVFNERRAIRKKRRYR